MKTFDDIVYENNIEIVNFPENHYVLKEKKTNLDLFYILTGTCEVVTGTNGDTLHLFDVKPGSLIGLISTFEKDHKVIASVKATTNCKLAKIKGEENLRLMESNDMYKNLLLSIAFTQFRTRMKQLIEQEKDSFEVQQKLILQEKMAAVGRVSASLAHELNNSISVIGKGLEFLYTELPKILKDRLSETENKIFSDALTLEYKLTFQDIRKKSVELSKEEKFTDINRRKISMALETQNNNPDIMLKDLVDLPDKELKNLHTLFLAGSKFKTLMQSGRQITHVVQHFKTLSKPPSKMEMVKLSETITNSLFLIEDRISNIVIDYDFNFDETVECRPEDLIQLWSNLISNASDSINGKGKITISTNKVNRMVSILIKDSGAGIPKDIAVSIFEPHITTKANKKTKSLGMGLGLTICKQIVETHHGRIEAISKAGEGIIKVTLPIRRKEDG